MAAETQLTIINQARTLVGEEVVTDLTPVDAMMRAALAHYEAIVTEEVENGAWLFALSLIVPDLASTDLTLRLPYEWTIPDDSLGVVSMNFCDTPLDGDTFDIRDQSAFTLFGANITMLYRVRADESVWPERFARIIVYRLASVFMRATERHSEAAAIDSDTARKSMIARHTEARQRKSRTMGEGSIVARRRQSLPRGRF